MTALHLLTALALWAGAAPKAAPVPKDPVLDQPIKELNANEDQQLLDLCEKIAVPCGIEDRFEDSLHASSAHARVRGTTPRKILDGVVKKHPAYAWEFSGGVLHFRYKNPAGFNNPLDKKIGPLTMTGASSDQAALDVLRIAGIPAGFSWVGKPAYGKASIKFAATTPREALDAVAKADGKLAWRLTVSSGAPNSLDLRTWNVAAKKEVKPAAPPQKKAHPMKR